MQATRKQRDTGASGVGTEATDSTRGPNFGLDDSAPLARRNVGEVEEDAEGLEIMKVLGRNRAWLRKKCR